MVRIYSLPIGLHGMYLAQSGPAFRTLVYTQSRRGADVSQVLPKLRPPEMAALTRCKPSIAMTRAINERNSSYRVAYRRRLAIPAMNSPTEVLPGVTK